MEREPAVAPPLPTQNRFVALETQAESVTNTLDAICPMIEGLKPNSDFETGVINILRLLVGQMRDFKAEMAELKNSNWSDFRQLDEDITSLAVTTFKTEQYSRRDTMLITGLPKPADESHEDLTKKVTETLSVSGQNISASDLSAVHRNAKESKTVRGKVVPPSVTVKFQNVSKKDSVLRSYRNFDTVLKRPRPVRVYQSLSPHYSELRSNIVKFFNDEDTTELYGISNAGKKLKWATYQSPTAGIVIKLKSDEYLKNIHTFPDFILAFKKYVLKTD